MPMLEVDNLHIEFDTLDGTTPVVRGVSFAMERGEMRALVGESGSGKTVTGLSLLGLIPARSGRIAAGRAVFEGVDLTALSGPSLRAIRGARIAMIFQNPLSSLDPSFTVGNQLLETIRHHQRLSRRAARAHAADLLDQVGIRGVSRVLDAYPFALSGGMRQRVMIAMAISCQPELLIADEPTTALDATIQRQILDLLRRINRELGTAILMITHDFGVVSDLCETVSVMYAGEVVEAGATRRILAAPSHPYTRALVRSLPDPHNWVREDGRVRLHQIGGAPPNPMDRPPGCPFAPRCDEATAVCVEGEPALGMLGDGRVVRCHWRGEGGGQ